MLRDPDGWTYFKEEVGGLVVGGFRARGEAVGRAGPDPVPFEFALLEEDWEHFSVLMDEAVRRVPALEHTGIRTFYNGPESFTPDNQFLMGEAPGLRGFFVGAGFNSVGIASAGGAGPALAEWVVAGEPTSLTPSRWTCAGSRPTPETTRGCWQRVVETLGIHYAVPWPNRQPETGRDVRLSPLHGRLAAKGARFGTKMGWERVNVFVVATAASSWSRPWWLGASIAEQVACRTAVAVFDQTSFSKYVVSGPDALAGLQWVCAADVDVPVGDCVYTPLLNVRGTYEADLTVTRTGAASFLMVCSSATTVRDLDWLRSPRSSAGGRRHRCVRRAGGDGASLTRSAVAGRPGVRLVGGGVPLRHQPEVVLAGASARATRMTYVGELGWELMVPVARPVRRTT